jgi:hypothetical protein
VDLGSGSIADTLSACGFISLEQLELVTVSSCKAPPVVGVTANNGAGCGGEVMITAGFSKDEPDDPRLRFLLMFSLDGVVSVCSGETDSNTFRLPLSAPVAVGDEVLRCIFCRNPEERVSRRLRGSVAASLAAVMATDRDEGIIIQV